MLPHEVATALLSATSLTADRGGRLRTKPSLLDAMSGQKN
jgi:hypothetical protein